MRGNKLINHYEEINKSLPDSEYLVYPMRIKLMKINIKSPMVILNNSTPKVFCKINENISHKDFWIIVHSFVSNCQMLLTQQMYIRWMDKYIIIYLNDSGYSPIKKNELVIHTTVWTDITNVELSIRSLIE